MIRRLKNEKIVTIRAAKVRLKAALANRRQLRRHSAPKLAGKPLEPALLPFVAKSPNVDAPRITKHGHPRLGRMCAEHTLVKRNNLFRLGEPLGAEHLWSTGHRM